MDPTEVRSEVNPYQPPAVNSGPGAPAPVAAAGYSDQGGVVLLLTVLLSGSAVVLTGLALAGLAVATPFLSEDTNDLLLRLSEQIDRSPQILFWAAMIPFAVFLVRANGNARRFGQDFMSFTAASMVWWYFVPLFNLVMPYHAVRETWKASRPAGASAVPDDADQAIVRWWWTAFIGFNVARLVASIVSLWYLGLADAERTHAGWVTNYLADGIRLLSAAALDVAALVMVRALHHRQRRRAGEEAMVASL